MNTHLPLILVCIFPDIDADDTSKPDLSSVRR